MRINVSQRWAAARDQILNALQIGLAAVGIFRKQFRWDWPIQRHVRQVDVAEIDRDDLSSNVRMQP